MKKLSPIVFLVVGYALGVLTWNIPEYTWVYEVDVVDLSVVLVGGLVVVVLQSHYNWAHTARRRARELVISNLGRAIVHLDNMRGDYMKCVENSPDPSKAPFVLGDVRGLANMLQRIKISLKACDISIKEADIDDLNCRYLHFKKVLTGGGYPYSPINASELANIEQSHTKLIDMLVSLQIQINNS